MTLYTPVTESTSIHEELKTQKRIRNHSLVMLVLGVVITLFTYQYFHHGLWGKLNNYNKLPMLVLNGTTVKDGQLNLSIYRPNGPDTYGSFVEEVTLAKANSTTPLETWTPSMLSKVSPEDIENVYTYQHVKTGPWGLVVPLAAKATVALPIDTTAMTAIQQSGSAQVTVQDVSGVSWTYTISLK